jgi:hypothetical protein
MRRSGVRFLFPAPAGFSQKAQSSTGLFAFLRRHSVSPQLSLDNSQERSRSTHRKGIRVVPGISLLFGRTVLCIYTTRLAQTYLLASYVQIAQRDFTFGHTTCLIGSICALSYNNALFSASHHQASTLVSRYRYIHRGKATVLVRDDAITARTPVS